MVNVFILGATGFIGYPVALALRRAGHIVHAVVRDPSKPVVKDLERQEIITFKGDGGDASTWSKTAAEADVIIDTSDPFIGAKVFKAILEAAKTRPKGAPKQTFIYTSGIWNHGDTRKQVTDRSILPGPVLPPQLVTSWRPDFEQEMISAASKEFIDTIIIRPAMVFGAGSTIFKTWFDPLIAASKGQSIAQVPLKIDALIPTVHREDLAESYRLIVEKSSILVNMSYPVFDISNPVESSYQIIHAAGVVLGVDPKAIQFVEPPEGFVSALSTTVVTSSERARDLTGWQARHPSITAGMEIYLRAYLAHQ